MTLEILPACVAFSIHLLGVYLCSASHTVYCNSCYEHLCVKIYERLNKGPFIENCVRGVFSVWVGALVSCRS